MYATVKLSGPLATEMERRVAKGFRRSHILRQALWAYFGMEEKVRRDQDDD